LDFEGDCQEFELFFLIDFKITDMLRKSLSLIQACSNRRSGLIDPEVMNRILNKFRGAFMFISPDDEVHKWWEHVGVDTRFIRNSNSNPFETVLMDKKDIHVIFARWFDEVNFLFLEEVVKSGVFDMSKSIQSDL
jgi:hypothetical protein